MTFKNENDHPFAEVARNADRQIQAGWTIFQKFTCQGCGSRQTINRPNSFYTVGQCEECNQFTDIVKHGCNFVAMIGVPDEIIREVTGGDDGTT
jgi:hypothetical protein